jgi:hypothetical protein
LRLASVNLLEYEDWSPLRGPAIAGEPTLKDAILIPELGRRVSRELSFASAEHKTRARRAICLLGGFDALGGQLKRIPQLDWSADPIAEQVLGEVAHSGTAAEVGTYGIQLWLGLKALHRMGQGPTTLAAMHGEDFFRRLAAAQPPTEEGRAIRNDLLKWLEQLRQVGWRLDRTA